MDYEIRRNKNELDSTGYMEIGPGKYSGEHWQDGFLFIWEDAFGMAEGIIAKHLPDYDHFGMNDIPKEIGKEIISEWEECAGQLCSLSTEQAQIKLNLGASYRENLESEISAHCAEVAGMLKELSAECRNYYKNEGHICVLGM
jgi:hypothetical protein